jgi:cyclic beta-1,2-glucan synthetase
MNDTAQIIDSQRTLSDGPNDRIRAAARASDSWDVAHRPDNKGMFPERAEAARLALKKLEGELAQLPITPAEASERQIPHFSALQDLRANPRLLRAAVTAVSDRPSLVARLPRVVSGKKEEPRVAKIAAAYLQAVDGTFSGPTLTTFVRELQTREPLTVDELWYVAPFLKFCLLELLLEEANVLLHSPQSVSEPKASVRLKSLRTVTNTDWVYLIEPLIVMDATLRQDPAKTYESMEFETRERYRKRIAFVARYSDSSESQVAQLALDLAREATSRNGEDPRMLKRRIHVGYYLIDKGFPQLAQRIDFHPPLLDRTRRLIDEHAEDFYITSIQLLTILFIAAILFPILPHSSGFVGLTIAFILLVVAATQDAVDLVNNAVSTIFDPEPLPKMDFSNGIPEECTTLVAVPTLLLNEDQVRELVTDLEVRFLANRDPHLHFVLLTDLPDAVNEPRDKDSHPLVELAIKLIDELNAKYASPANGSFLLLHRHRVFNRRQGVWMGWERKRGKLLDLNKLLAGDFDAFPIKAGKLEALHFARYVLTLDSDTQLPRGVASRLIGAMAHPLNQAVIHPKLRIVTEGYGILQPRIGIAVQSASRSRLAVIYSGQSGFDIYTRAISDAYQDLFREGIFTGKGIYEISTLHAVLDRRFPRNALLSHDLIEGSYARAGQVTDVELIDDYPSHYSAYSRRKHRWVRGDWQIAQWMFTQVPDESGKLSKNPISYISRWKIFDNLRRSLLDSSLFAVFIAGWLGLPGGPLYWTIIPLILLIFPTISQLCFAFGRAVMSEHKQSMGEAFTAFGQGLLIALLNLIFIPHQTLLAFDAIIRSLVRVFITGERLLEWETAAQAETKSSKRTPVDRYLAWTPLFAIFVAAIVYLLAPHKDAIYYAAPILLLWALASAVTAWLNQPPQEQHQHLAPSDRTYLLGHALHIWRYFHQFGGERHNYLIPDNVEEEGLFEAARVSPTNVGLLLNARQAAVEFGFVTVPEFVTLTQATLATIERLEKFRGHLLNWYDTQTLKPLAADSFVSSVDSGNLVASFLTLHSGALDLLDKPLLSGRQLSGLRTHWNLLQAQGKLPSKISSACPPLSAAASGDWICCLPAAEEALIAAGSDPKVHLKDTWWLAESLNRVKAVRSLLANYLPWMLPEYAKLRALPQLATTEKPDGLSPKEAIAFAVNLDARVARAWDTLSPDGQLLPLAEELRESLAAAIKNLRKLVADLNTIARHAEQLANDTEFGFLVDKNRQILSIGYEMSKHKTHEACYDMLASEARIATFLAVARGELRQESWFKLARDYANAFGHFLLLSWTGTMFEYLMPALWMRSFPNTLISRTLVACVNVQRDFARKLGIPWGISESGSARKDDAGHYHYQAYGIPQIALWFEADAGPVVSPYSTFLALGVDCREALYNLRRMESSSWVGAYGFYESADFINSLKKPTVTREWMAHHQGMAFLAIVNLLCDNVVQRWFHANPLVQSAELLLHEVPTSKGVMKARLQEFAPIASNSSKAA